MDRDKKHALQLATNIPIKDLYHEFRNVHRAWHYVYIDIVPNLTGRGCVKVYPEKPNGRPSITRVLRKKTIFHISIPQSALDAN